MNRIVFPALLLLGFLSGCTHRLQTPVITSVGSYQKQLSHLTHWQLEGKIGVRHGNQSDSAAIQWQQRENHFDIFLSGPLGAGATRLTGTGNQLTLDTGEETSTLYTDAEHIIEKRLGWTLPLEKLPQWITGRSENRNAQFNKDYTLTHFSENEWQVDYLSYQTVGSWLLPAKIVLKHEDMQITIVIKQWLLH